ncbi:MAG TPA: FmdB family zinc ribbon protein [Actinomycetota bacterium]
MPTYEYQCTECGERVEVFQRLAEDPLTECAVCGGPLRKLFHPVGIAFKGSGFYKTDSRKAASDAKKKASPKPAEKPAEKKDAGGTSGSSGTKEKSA